jgi:hypothetical protein
MMNGQMNEFRDEDFSQSQGIYQSESESTSHNAYDLINHSESISNASELITN